MNKKKIIAGFIASALTLPTMFGLVGCKPESPSVDAREVYAMSALSSLAYLTNETTGPLASPANTTAQSRPQEITANMVNGIYNSVKMFDSVVSHGGFNETVENNNNADYADYKLQMKISLPDGSGQLQVCTMYFNETKTQTRVEIDDAQEEIEENTSFEGVLVYESETYIVDGVREIETEGRETEYEIEFNTYKTTGEPTNLVKDENNYVKVEQSFEVNNRKKEIEYEYTFVEGGSVKGSVELEYETSDRGAEIELEFNENEEYTIKKGSTSNTFEVYNEANQRLLTITNNSGSYEFEYTNGFRETPPVAVS